MNFSVNNIQTVQKKPVNVAKSDKQVNFGNSNSDYDDDMFEMQNSPTKHRIRNTIKTITASALGIGGFNIALYVMQDFISSKLLIGKINTHFTKNINDNNKLETLAKKMRAKEGLDKGDKKVKMFCNGNSKDAYFNHATNQVVVGEKEYSSLFHELGHAIIENKTTLLRKLQRGRGYYTIIAAGLYTIANQNKNNDPSQKSNKFSTLIPLIAYSPELITEGLASKHGLKFLKSVREDVVKEKFAKGLIEKLPEKSEMISKEMYKNIKHSYATCFCTYLFFPISIIILDKLDDWAHKRS